MTKWFILVALVSCSTAQQMSSQDLVKVGTLKREISIDGFEQAKAVVNNQARLWKELFTQSFDPYYNTPRWTDHCLKANQVGFANVDDKRVSLVSRFWLNTEGAVGSCPDTFGAVEHYVVMQFCPGDKNVKVYHIPVTAQVNLSKGIKCQ